MAKRKHDFVQPFSQRCKALGKQAGRKAAPSSGLIAWSIALVRGVLTFAAARIKS